MALMQQPNGNFRFLATNPNAPFSGGALADQGYTIVHATLHRPLPYRDGFALIERHLSAQGRPRAALCAVELRCAKPYARPEFDAFNQGYRALHQDWGILVDGYSPTARSNVASAVLAPSEQTLYAFSYTAPATNASGPSFVLSGSAERADLRPGETSVEAMREKTADILNGMDRRLGEVGAGWQDVTAVNVYTTHPIHALLERDLLGRIGPAAQHGLHWFFARPPVERLEIEIDVRGTPQELRLPS